MTKYVGCIDLHDGSVKQIVGATLTTDDKELATNYVSTQTAGWYANLYKENNVIGTHVIKLGTNEANDNAAKEALSAWPHKLQVGGGITLDNCEDWIKFGADKVIITSWLFPEGELSWERLRAVSEKVGRDHLVVDVSCKRTGDAEWTVAMNKWQTLTKTKLDKALFERLSEYCSEFLVHAADVEGLCRGIDEDLVRKLGEWCGDLNGVKVVYAGGAKSVEDLPLVDKLSDGLVDLTYGSALDIFGGSVKFTDLVKWNKQE
ncbi:hypothetical protein CANINC_005044 [Pichia inconspicua]|uniref:1-(5-phosphoribosyl)-5-[(5-phosphoribosylamino)methylideneamino] imidazole-4-carboxamide isomerase n=1 Tax=Pichia inconspicua TaxID=52247 RepID=A0A4T0WUA7_9ASCO|nr:hypothetical protein CANINC_005044 [[Candida] inconspicua]